MNFFGHAIAAARDDPDPVFVLGAMLPDLATMAGTRMGPVAAPRLAAGVAHHHETDRLFHAHARFVALCRDARERLTAAGCSRASARAVGHVGSELLLDGLLSEDDAGHEVYRRALAHGLEHDLAAQVEWLRGEAPQLTRVLSRLAGAPVPAAYRDPSFVASRLERILARRPRLALLPRDRAPVLAWLERAHAELEQSHGEILELICR